MAAVQLELPEKLIPVFEGRADIRGAYGGRGSAKTRSFALMAAVRGYIHGTAGEPGIILCARQFMNSLEDSSLEEVKRAIEDTPFLLDYYDIGDKYIKSHDGRISFAFAGLDRNIASVKSKGRLLLCWIDEAEPVTDEAFATLIPTLREEGTDWNAELWITWNPKRKNAPVERFRKSRDDLIKLVELNWRDNPKFPDKLARDKARDLEERPDQYEWIWEGAYLQYFEGAYYAYQMKRCDQEKRIGDVPYDYLAPVHTAWDLGYSDDTAIWFYQVISGEVRVINHYSANGKDIKHYAGVIKSKPYKYGLHHLPHDARAKTLASGGRSTVEQLAEYLGMENMRIVPNLSIQDGIQAVRLMFPRVWFDAIKCADGIESLRQYQRAWDEKLQCFKEQPLHDWTSHDADGFRMLAVAWREEHAPKEPEKPLFPVTGVKDGFSIAPLEVLWRDQPIKRSGRI